MKKKNFTLIELLVVVAIIGILASLLLPALGKARKTAQQAVCVSNFKQIGIAINMYTDDNEDAMPSASSIKTTSRLGWRDLLTSYMGKGDYTALSNGDLRDFAAGAPFRCPNTELSFGYDRQDAGSTYNIKFGDMRYNARPPIKLSDIQSTAETGVVADSIDDTTDWAEASRNLPSEDAVGDRHKGGLNVLWADNHVKWHSQAYISAGQGGSQDYYYLTTKP